MKWIATRARQGELLCGAWLNLGSSLTAEIAGRAGFDWACIDLEHGAGDLPQLLTQLHALEATRAAAVVRLAWNDPVLFKRVLDLGPSGIIVPFVNSVAEAQNAVAAMRYPPRGIRGVAKMNRAMLFGSDFDRYYSEASDNLLLAVQIETRQAVAASADIAAVEGVSVLFVGPLDLSVSLGVPQDYEHDEFVQSLKRVVESCRSEGKAAGILCPSIDQIPQYLDLGFTFITASSDGAMVHAGMNRLAKAFGEHKSAYV